MAKKDEELKYLQMPLPQPNKEKSLVKTDWSGLNRAQVIDTGELSSEMNISTSGAPSLTPSPKRVKIGETLKNPVGLWGFDDFLIAICEVSQDGKEGLGVVRMNPDNTVIKSVFPTSISGDNDYSYENPYAQDLTTPREAVVMDIFDGGPIDGISIKKLLIFPDRVSMNFDAGVINQKGLEIALIPDNEMPNIRYATVHLSRLYGVASAKAGEEPDRICVSGYNSYANWDVDTADDFSEAHAWFSAAQSNVKATGCFSGITTYLNSVVAFKKDYMHEITGSSNPFRINDVFSEGTDDMRTIAEVDGILFFVGNGEVKVYTGGNPRVMSYKLGLGSMKNAVAGTDGRKYYLYCEDEADKKHVFVYDTLVGQWAEEASPSSGVIFFAHNNKGMFMLTKSGEIFHMDGEDYSGQSWQAETDITLGNTVDIKHVSKICMLADIAAESSLKVEIITDEGSHNERRETVFERTNASKTTIRTAIRVSVRKSAHWGAKLRLSGVGWCRIYQAELILRSGGKLMTTLEQEWM